MHIPAARWAEWLDGTPGRSLRELVLVGFAGEEHLSVLLARPPAEVDADSEAAELACRHIVDRCRELAAACRAGQLPRDASCSFWVEWSQTAFNDAEALFPAGMWAAWQALRPRARELEALARRR